MRCIAYCTADSYNVPKLYDLMREHYGTTLYRDAMHISLGGEDQHIFFFPYGAVVFWGLSESEESHMLERLKVVESGTLTTPEWDKLEVHQGEVPRIQRDAVTLTNKDVLTKLSISFALAQSVKLSMFEVMIDQTISTTRSLPIEMASKGKISLSRKAISKKMGELFLNRSSVNLHSDILDEPDFFWEYPEHHPLYRDVHRCFDLAPRVDVLNKRLTILSDLLNILSDQLNHQHSSILEWTIIWLIVIEVVLVLITDVFHFL